MLSLFAKARTAIYVSEPDIQAALDHLRALPYSRADSTPRAWDRQRLVIELQEQARKGALGKVGEMQSIGPGVWALVRPLGVDLIGMPDDTKGLQVWLLIRRVGTDPAALTEI